FSLSPLSPSARFGSCDPSPSKRRPGHHRPSRSPPWVPSGPPPCRRRNLANLHPGAALSWPENRRFIDLLFMDNQASEVQPISRRNLQRAKLARTICRRSAQDPPPGHSKLPHRHVKIFGISQNRGETLPKFRQKSKGS
ncbi:AP2/B3-like transcriptional factor family protein, partial [Prunus dulcis]